MITLSTAQQQRLNALLPMPPDPLLQGLDCYVVGGAVRDALLELPAGDRDWVVVGATPEQMSERGFIPVGGDFPVFLHPKTKEEFALARTERKSGRGYQGFTFYTGTDVTLADDLARRDLTINAMAIDAAGLLHDPLNGYADLQARLLQHINGAFVEDPVRLLRLARFAARFYDFTITANTMELAQQLVHNGEVDALVPERVWQELHKGLNTKHPMRMLTVMAESGALVRVIPHLLLNEAVTQAVQCGVEHSLKTEQIFALLCHQSPEPAEIANHLRAPTQYKELARLLPLFMQQSAQAHSAERIAELLQRCDVLRRPQRFSLLLEAAGCIAGMARFPRGELATVGAGYARDWAAYATAFASVDAGIIAKACAAKGDAKKIPEAVWAARVAAIASHKKTPQYNSPPLRPQSPASN